MERIEPGEGERRHRVIERDDFSKKRFSVGIRSIRWYDWAGVKCKQTLRTCYCVQNALEWRGSEAVSTVILLIYADYRVASAARQELDSSGAAAV
jgi:hypothetical protein